MTPLGLANADSRQWSANMTQHSSCNSLSQCNHPHASCAYAHPGCPGRARNTGRDSWRQSRGTRLARPRSCLMESCMRAWECEWERNVSREQWCQLEPRYDMCILFANHRREQIWIRAKALPVPRRESNSSARVGPTCIDSANSENRSLQTDLIALVERG